MHTFYYYHKDGHYNKRDNDTTERYDKVDELKNGSNWLETLQYVNECRRQSWPKKPPIFPERVYVWDCGKKTVVDTSYTQEYIKEEMNKYIKEEMLNSQQKQDITYINLNVVY
jgi:hypothetical protein